MLLSMGTMVFRKALLLLNRREKMKKIILIFLLVLLINPIQSLAIATKDPHRLWEGAVPEIPKRETKDDILFQDFTSVEEGEFPAGVTGERKSYSYVTTAEHQILPGLTKNCLVLNVPDERGSIEIINSNVKVPPTSGLVKFEIRYKYIPTEKSSHTAFIISLRDSAGTQFSRMLTRSDNGWSSFNYAGADSGTFERAKMIPDGWYTYTNTIDFDKKIIDAKLLNETTGVTTKLYGKGFFNSGDYKNIGNVNFRIEKYGGTVVIDYVRIAKTDMSLSEIDLENESEIEIEKGMVPQYTNSPIAMPISGRINLIVDEKQVYTTLKPYETSNGNVMASIKNLVHAIGATCLIDAKSITVNKNEIIATFKPQNGTANVNGKSFTLKEDVSNISNQMVVSIEDFAKIFEYEYRYDEDKLLIYLEGVGQNEKNN